MKVEEKGKNQFFELGSKITELDSLMVKRIMPLEQGLESLLKDSKGWHYQLNRIITELNNKCKNQNLIIVSGY